MFPKDTDSTSQSRPSKENSSPAENPGSPSPDAATTLTPVIEQDENPLMPTATNVVPAVAAALTHATTAMIETVRSRLQRSSTSSANANTTNEDAPAASREEVDKKREADRMGWAIAMGAALDTPGAFAASHIAGETEKGRDSMARAGGGEQEKCNDDKGNATAPPCASSARPTSSDNTAAPSTPPGEAAGRQPARTEKVVEKLEAVIASVERAAEAHEHEPRRRLGPYGVPGAAGTSEMDPISTGMAAVIANVDEGEEN